MEASAAIRDLWMIGERDILRGLAALCLVAGLNGSAHKRERGLP